MREKISRKDVNSYKREILEQTTLVALPEAAQIMACSERKVQRLVAEGKLNLYNETMRKGQRLLARDLRDYVRSIKINIDDLRR